MLQKQVETPKFAAGTFTPSSNLRSVTINDLKGKNSFLIHPISDITVSSRVQYGGFTLRNQCKFCRSSNTGKSSWTAIATGNFSTGAASNALSFNSTTGVVSILTAADTNGGGYFLSGVTYAYAGWIEDGTEQTGDFITGSFTPTSNTLNYTVSNLVGKNCFIVWKDVDGYSTSYNTHIMDIVYKNVTKTSMSKRTNGSTYWGDPSTWTAYGTGNNSANVTYASTTGKITVKSNTYSGGRGYFLANTKYYYAAWNVD